MRSTLLLAIVLLNIGSLKTESIEYVGKNGRLDIPFRDERVKDAGLLIQPRADDFGEHELLNDIELKYRPDNGYRKILNLYDNEEYNNDDIDLGDNQYQSIDQLDDAQLAQFSRYLIKLLQRPDVWEAPLVLIKDSQDNSEERNFPMELDGVRAISKRSRYYRRYPWKRQNARSYNSMEYDPYNTCNPTRNDVFQLLVALHDARQGNKSRLVNFCNRRRPASAVYTNIRFLGRRKK